MMNTYIVPPSNFEFNVMITEPIQIMTKTSANSGPPSPTCIESGDACSTLKSYFKIYHISLYNYLICSNQYTYMAINVQSIKGPHKSPKKMYIHKIVYNNTQIT